MQEGLRPGRTSRSVNIHRKHLVNATQRRVVLAENTTANAAGAHGDHHFGFRHRPIRFQKRELHVAGDRPGHQEHIGMTRRCDEVNAEAFDIIDRIVQGDDLQFASVA